MAKSIKMKSEIYTPTSRQVDEYNANRARILRAMPYQTGPRAGQWIAAQRHVTR